MKLIEAQTRIEKLAYVPFKEYLLPNQVQDAMMKINKGKTGQLLELTIGLELSNTPLDFEDGELKTNKCDRSGKPLETMFITQIASIIDELLAKRQFQETKYIKNFNVCYTSRSAKMEIQKIGCIYLLFRLTYLYQNINFLPSSLNQTTMTYVTS